MDLKERNVKILELASLEVNTIASAKKKELLDYCKDLIPSYSKMTKPQMIDALLSITKETRDKLELDRKIEEEKKLNEILEQQVVLKEAVIESIEISQEELENKYNKIKVLTFGESLTSNQDYALQVFVKIKSVVENIEPQKKTLQHKIASFDSMEETETNIVSRHKANKDLKDLESSLYARISAIGNSFINTLKMNDDNVMTLKGNRTAIFREIRLLCFKEITYRDELLQALEIIRKISFEYTREDVTEKDKEYKVKLVERSASPDIFDPFEIFNRYYEIIKNPSIYKWTQVLLALGFATGRRPSELLVSSVFEKVDDFTIKFTGQAKKRKREDFKPKSNISIPTIFKADYCINALSHLKSQGKFITYDIREKYDELFAKYDDLLAKAKNEVHQYDLKRERSMEVSNLFDEHTKLMALSNSRYSKEISRTIADDKDKNLASYTMKELRAMYAFLTHPLIYGVDSTYTATHFGLVLGHGEENEAGDTFKSYEKYRIEQSDKQKWIDLVKEQA
ncbi:protelomerase family protein [Scytonema sp. NUACC26]|uniref:protelomerase family protein n=1 Tax=Scytonema sp. NUACC26 TaxID=3140176 RepID=UPI0034DBB74E